MLVDYAFPPHPSIDALRAAGATDVSRYLSYIKTNTAPKIITAGEYQALLAAGIAVVLNWEYDTYDFVNTGFDARVAASEALRQANALGYPQRCPIYFSVDFDATAGQWPTIVARFRAVNDVLGVARTGIYGPWDALEWARRDGVASWFWQAGMSTSWSAGRNAQLWPGAHLRQRRTAIIGGADCDINDIVQANYGQTGGGPMSDADIPDTRRLAGNGDTWGRAAITGEDPAHFLGGVGVGTPATTPNVLHHKLDAILDAAHAAATAPAAVALTDADRAAIAEQVVSLVGARLDAIAAKLDRAGQALASDG